MGEMCIRDSSRMLGEKTVLFVDEIHRFNKAQQDAFLPFVEKGSIILIGATTENPSFEVNSALLSRCKVFVLKPLSVQELQTLLHHALTDEKGFGAQRVEMKEEWLEMIAAFANGDARVALNTLAVSYTHLDVYKRQSFGSVFAGRLSFDFYQWFASNHR